MKRGSGILLHISSLPSAYGIGDFGETTCRFIDFLQESGQSYWQVLPLTPTNGIYGHSPYSSPSAFAGNILFISPDEMLKDGWLQPEDLKNLPLFSSMKVDYPKVEEYKNKIFDLAYDRFQKKGGSTAYAIFVQEHKAWLENYALFVVLKKNFQGAVWNAWPKPCREGDPKALSEFAAQNKQEIEKVKFLQFVFFKQWLAVRAYSAKKNVRIIGDIPIYVTDDSADVWRHRDIFKLDENGNPRVVAGVPPDYFSATGQRWGNPVYDWDRLKETGYRWWMDRIHHNLRLFDIIRIDHFRGFIGYWQIPSEEKTAVNGAWQPGPGDHFFHALKKEFKDLPIIAEDLGIITDDVKEAMARFGFPGMKVLLFAYGGDIKTHPYIPENYTDNDVAYTGTHDNNTVLGWLAKDASPHEISNLAQYFGKTSFDDDLPWLMIKSLMESVANLVIVPIQDVLGLGHEARMNVPSTVHGNWSWRLPKIPSSPLVNQRLRKLAESSKRI